MVTGLHPWCPLPPTLTLPLGGGSCEKIEKSGAGNEKILDYTYDYMLSSFYPT
jgi:hypothetical protein